MRTNRLWLFFLLLAGTIRSADNPMDMMRIACKQVAEQIAQNANYTCVETIERTYQQDKDPHPQGCTFHASESEREIYMRDRLRLDLAVSEGNEIYAWHGQKQFSSSEISTVVRNGPISSGNFVGVLHNVFLNAGTQFQYAGRTELNGVQSEKFNYVVPLAASRYRIQARHGNPIVAFHGSFTLNASDYQLTSLRVIADGIPSDSDICEAETEVNYQLVPISGKISLVPSVFLLRLDQNTHVYTLSRSEYTGCREFRGESTIRFDMSNTQQTIAQLNKASEKPWLPPGLPLKVEIQTPVNDKVSYAGDAVEGVLREPLHLPNGTLIQKGATLQGVITELEFYYQPWKHYLLRIEFESLQSGNNSCRLRALPITSSSSAQAMLDTYGPALPDSVRQELQTGIFAWQAPHFALDRHFTGNWRTTEPPTEGKTAGRN